MMRRRGVGLLGVAAVAGVAHHAGTKSAQAQANEQAQNQQLADLEAQNAAMQQQLAAQQAPAAPAPAPAAPAPAAAPAGPAAGTDLTAQIQQLAALHTAGVLSDEEFAAGKAKLLAGG
jgi:hypothetical protein